jgi:hypothetical protein
MSEVEGPSRVILEAGPDDSKPILDLAGRIRQEPTFHLELIHSTGAGGAATLQQMLMDILGDPRSSMDKLDATVWLVALLAKRDASFRLSLHEFNHMRLQTALIKIIQDGDEIGKVRAASALTLMSEACSGFPRPLDHISATDLHAALAKLLPSPKLLPHQKADIVHCITILHRAYGSSFLSSLLSSFPGVRDHLPAELVAAVGDEDGKLCRGEVTHRLGGQMAAAGMWMWMSMQGAVYSMALMEGPLLWHAEDAGAS